MDFSTVAGWIGMVLIPTAYYLVSNKKFKGEDRLYQLLNFFGALGIILNTNVN